MKKGSALGAWTMMATSLPRAIATFVVGVAGTCMGLSLAIVVAGLPILAATLVWCERMMRGERRLVSQWEMGTESGTRWSAEGSAELPEASLGWRGWLTVLGQGRMYRGLAFGVLQLPASIAAFTIAVTLPVTAWAILMSPVADYVSNRFFDYGLFSNDWLMNKFLSDWSSANRSWLVAGIGILCVLIVPFLLRRIGRLYAGWIYWLTGEEPQPNDQHSNEAPSDESNLISVH
jgi:hypothetical protein